MPTVLVRIHAASIVSDVVVRRLGHGRTRPLRVQSVYRSVLNIATADGLLTIASPAGGGLPNGILADLGPDWRGIGLAPGMLVTATDTAIRVPDAGLEIRIDRASRWSPRLRPSARAVDLGLTRWARRAAEARSTALSHAAVGGFGALLRAESLPAGDATVEVARPLVAELLVGLEAGDRLFAAAAARRLIGLGSGLTPSGDDFLVGLEAALRALAHPSAGFLALAIGDARTRTTEIAATYLRHAAAGEFAERLHTLLTTLLGPDDEQIPAAMEQAVAWGATSGTDCLVGVLLGLDIAADVRRAAA